MNVRWPLYARRSPVRSENDQTREEIAALLRRVTESLDNGDAITLKAGSESVTLDPPTRPTFEVKAEREGPANGPGELSIEFELEWDEDGDGTVGAAVRNRVIRGHIGCPKIRRRIAPVNRPLSPQISSRAGVI